MYAFGCSGKLAAVCLSNTPHHTVYYTVNVAACNIAWMDGHVCVCVCVCVYLCVCVHVCALVFCVFVCMFLLVIISAVKQGEDGQ